MPKKHIPDDKTRGQVSALSGFGVPHEDIASYLGITRPTLDKYYKEELKSGVIRANAAIAKTLFEQAKAGNTTACIFWLKTRAGWREVQKMELSGNDGQAIDVKGELKMTTTLADLMLETYEGSNT